jgi:tRNA (uracil-5-)-methyltransferase
MHSFADLVQVVTPNLDLRDDSRVQCRYFGRCAGCQYQVRCWVKTLFPDPNAMPKMLSYDSQLSFKRDVIVKAYRNFSGTLSRSLSHTLYIKLL